MPSTRPPAVRIDPSGDTDVPAWNTTTSSSGPAARGYLQDAPFAERSIAVEWFDYSGYPQYPQLWGAFEHGVSVLDLIFNCGPEAPQVLRARRAA